MGPVSSLEKKELEAQLFNTNLREMVTMAGSVDALAQQAQKMLDDEAVGTVGAATGAVFSVAVSDWAAFGAFVKTNNVPQNRPFLRALMVSTREAIAAQDAVLLASLLLSLLCFNTEKPDGGV